MDFFLGGGGGGGGGSTATAFTDGYLRYKFLVLDLVLASAEEKSGLAAGVYRDTFFSISSMSIWQWGFLSDLMIEIIFPCSRVK